MDHGWESAHIAHSAVQPMETPILQASRVDYKWNHLAGNGDSHIWQNPELVNKLFNYSINTETISITHITVIQLDFIEMH